MISARRVTACGFSIFAITAARPRVIFLASAISSGRWMNESATQSTPVFRQASRSERSLSVSAEEPIVVSGRLTPLRADSLPPTTTRVTARFGDVSVATSLILPSSSSSVWPTSSAARISGCGRCTRVASPGALSSSSTKVAPFSSVTLSSLKVPTRSFGPCRSARMPIGRPEAFSTARIAACSLRIASCDVWLMLMRNTSAPASNSRAIVASSEEEGPSVAMIFVRRSRLIWSASAVSRRAARGSAASIAAAAAAGPDLWTP